MRDCQAGVRLALVRGSGPAVTSEQGRLQPVPLDEVPQDLVTLNPVPLHHCWATALLPLTTRGVGLLGSFPPGFFSGAVIPQSFSLIQKQHPSFSGLDTSQWSWP